MDSDGYLPALGSLSAPADSTVSFGTTAETWMPGDRQNPESKCSPSYRDDKSNFSSLVSSMPHLCLLSLFLLLCESSFMICIALILFQCPTGRFSFKLYDWNPAEFPRQLRHQVLQILLLQFNIPGRI